MAVGRLPALEHVILEPHGIGERVERERVLGRSVDAEEVDLRPEREHEGVVLHRLELAEGHLALLQVDPRHAVLVDADVVLLVEEIADRMPDGRLLEQAGRDLVEQRLEGVVVVPVHEHDVDVALLQLLRGADPAEPCAQDHDPVAAAARVGSSGHGHQATDERLAPRSPEGDETSAAGIERISAPTCAA